MTSLKPEWLPNFAKAPYAYVMSTMNISLPDSLKAFVDEQVSQRGFGTAASMCGS